MAQPQAPMHPGRQLGVLGTIFVLLAIWVWFGGDGGWRNRLEPNLGLDLIGGTTVTLQAKTDNGKPPTKQQMETAKDIIDSRVNGLGVSEAEVVIEGDTNINVSLPGKSDDRLKQIGQTAELRFRKVLGQTQDIGDTNPSASASASPSVSASGSAPAASASASTSAKPSTSASAPASSAPASAAPSASGSAPASSAPPVAADVAQQRAAVQKKIGDAAWAAAMQEAGPVDLSADPSKAALYAPFKSLTPEEVAVLPPAMQFNIPFVTCDKLDNRPVGSIRAADQPAVACEPGVKYNLDVAKVLGTDVSKADSSIDSTNGKWIVTISFKGDGQDAWTDLTREAYNNGTDSKQVAVVLDNKVVSAPVIESVIPGDARITGQFTKRDTELLANQLQYGALPLSFVPQDAQSISATLGSSHLEAGVLAAGIGLALVVLYSFFYYRLLGLVITLSLVLSGAMVYMALIILGRTMGFTLTLAGFAGFIVSLGVAADSFVIYFERLKDEIREGRSPRSAVPRAWVRARRTIISANAITLLAAAVLYFFSIGSVKGFAFALGVATILDLVVVFLFRHPIMTLFARSKAFLSPRVSGLGRIVEQRPGAGVASSAPRRNRPKEV
ncbi:protein translocase subunit SecD [Dactylosporangium aurantiacum]|uniref:Protein translocase subunit SecD n=1 Tax=Dactylosporangium aurantiacum TaxID=35754 RepID=A0A9Q9MHR0_9ACTN|nr:protein translocase subunit SecD [Dactylosporangium aurantiacum]MDG6102861.1 protein translocase subunit SecD [Dactylosporangium aurantiacum]UWZ52901.1 protein translocase subunit SecD [Dactylosporangium aurantiacum]